MNSQASRRRFLAAGLALPAAGVAAAQTDVDIRYGTLGATGLKVSKVSFGCLVTSDPSVVEKAADLGINYFDTARSYQDGNNERMVGAALKSRRKDVVIISKTGGRTKDVFVEHLETSLRELGTDYIDVWCLHGRSKPEDITDDLVDALQTAKKQGKIRFAGVSIHRGHKVLIPALARNSNIDVILASYNFTMKDDAELDAAIAEAHKAGKGVIAMKVMAGGFRRMKPDNPLYSKLKQEGAMLAMLKWALKNPNIDAAIPSIADMDQLDENMKAMSSLFSGQDEQLLARQLDYIRPLYCRTCGACDGHCPKGLPASDILRHLSYADGYGQFQLARESFLELPTEVRSVRCKDCSECAISCPNGVRVAERLTRAQELLA